MSLADRPRRILFVDDDQAMLNGLRNALRRDRDRWSMTFVLGSDAALAALAAEPFDIIVSDLRMPGMDGVELLTIVRATYPRIGRIMLSGNVDRESVTRIAPVVHAHLSKPCDPVVLRDAIERVDKLPFPRP